MNRLAAKLFPVLTIISFTALCFLIVATIQDSATPQELVYTSTSGGSSPKIVIDESKELVIVTTLSREDVATFGDFCRSIEDYNEFKHFVLYVYNIGMVSDVYLDSYSEECPHAIFRYFVFSSYPSFVGNLTEERYKHIIISHLLAANDVVLWIDPTFRLNNSKPIHLSAMQKHAKTPGNLGVVQHASSGPFLSELMSEKFLDKHFDYPSKMAAKVPVFNSDLILWTGARRSQSLNANMVSCALDQACMELQENHVDCGKRKKEHSCYRTEEAALSAVLSQAALSNITKYTLSGGGVRW